MGTEAYTLGRGEVHFSKFKTGTQIGEGFRYLGNSPEWSLNVESEQLDHFSSDRGIRQKDKSVSLEVTRTGSLVLDEITMPNVGLFLFSPNGASTVTDTALTVTGYAIAGIIKGYSYQLGQTSSDPTGDQKISTTGLVVKKGATVLTAGVDYLVDFARGLLTILDSGVTLVNGDNITVDYSRLLATYEAVISGEEKVEGELKYIEYNPTGINKVWTMPYVSISPNGELSFKGDEWQQMPLNIEVLKKSPLAAIYVNAVAV